MPVHEILLCNYWSNCALFASILKSFEFWRMPTSKSNSKASLPSIILTGFWFLNISWCTQLRSSCLILVLLLGKWSYYIIMEPRNKGKIRRPWKMELTKRRGKKKRRGYWKKQNIGLQHFKARNKLNPKVADLLFSHVLHYYPGQYISCLLFFCILWSFDITLPKKKRKKNLWMSLFQCEPTFLPIFLSDTHGRDT